MWGSHIILADVDLMELVVHGLSVAREIHRAADGLCAVSLGEAELLGVVLRGETMIAAMSASIATCGLTFPAILSRAVPMWSIAATEWPGFVALAYWVSCGAR